MLQTLIALLQGNQLFLNSWMFEAHVKHQPMVFPELWVVFLNLGTIGIWSWIIHWYRGQSHVL